LLFGFPILIGFPHFWIAAGLMLVAYLAAFIPYSVSRNQAVPPHQKVFTPEWFRYEFAKSVGKVGIKMETERKADYEKGPPVDLIAFGGDDRQNNANLLTARQSPGYILVKEFIADMVARNSARAVLDYTQQSVLIRHQIDGVWHNSEPRDRESGDVMLAVMKTLANLNVAERRQKQSGKLGAKFLQFSYWCPIVSQGVKTGERVIFEIVGGKVQSYRTYEELGMRDKLREQWGALMGLDVGLLIISGLPEGGITTLTDVSLMETDRLLRDFASIEEENHREREIENIEITTYKADAGESPVTILPRLIRKYPNVYVARDFVDPEAARLLFREIHDDHLVVTNIQAKDAPEALLRMLQKKVPQKEFAEVVTAVLYTRLVRKLCDACKVGYDASPDLLKKLGIPAGKITTLYRTPKPEEIDKPCLECGAIGYRGRTGIYELLVVSEEIRELLIKQPKIDLLRQAARRAGMRSLQEEGILVVARGVTSLQELQRVLQQ
jgi:type II secretory ATPase GspE/PulE/Tfp pilus assembly ATPase PilB-like protein